MKLPLTNLVAIFLTFYFILFDQKLSCGLEIRDCKFATVVVAEFLTSSSFCYYFFKFCFLDTKENIALVSKNVLSYFSIG